MLYSERLRIRTVFAFCYWEKASLPCFLIPSQWSLYPLLLLWPHQPPLPLSLPGLQPQQPSLDPLAMPSSCPSKNLGPHFLFLAHSYPIAVLHLIKFSLVAQTWEVHSERQYYLLEETFPDHPAEAISPFHPSLSFPLWYSTVFLTSSTFLPSKASSTRVGTLHRRPCFLQHL